jgi:hypothetical protein
MLKIRYKVIRKNLSFKNMNYKIKKINKYPNKIKMKTTIKHKYKIKI